jgi:hypothetical protein
MSENITLMTYLEQRGGKAKALKRVEAEAFGIPYPLQAGWPKRYGSMKITAAMIEDARSRMRGGAGKVRAPAIVTAVVTRSAFPGFVLRQARRYRARKSEPWS